MDATDNPVDPPEHAAFVNHTPPADADERNLLAMGAAAHGAAAVAASVAQLDPEPARPAPPAPPPEPTASLASQIGGNHYTKMKVQPLTFAMANQMGFVEGTVVKYVSRWRSKGGIQDLEKALDVLKKYVAHLHDEAAEALRNPGQ